MLRALVATAFVCAALMLHAAPARACGGFFCQRMPMNQAGEKIVFAVEADGTVTVHVQILYAGAADQFAWILPVPAVPTLSTGTDMLFQMIDPATAPSFELDYVTEGTCRLPPSCPSPYPPYDEMGWGAADASAALDAGRSGVEVYFMDAVGPYDAVVLGSDDAAALRAWLTDNGYDLPAAALPLLDHYVAKHDLFVALKLQQERGVGEIQPIVLNFRERQPCIPIRLTAIATIPDMPITAWVLGDRRAMPYNYMDVRPDLDIPELWLGGRSYASVVTEAVDAAGGRGFVTDYAGEVPSITLPVPEIAYLRTETDPRTFLSALFRLGFSGDAQLLSLLMRHIPPPAGTSPQDFYNCVVSEWCYDHGGYLASLAFDPAAMVDDLEATILAPRREAQAMLDRHSKLTRLFTTMSAHEMTEDPVFVMRDMPDVSRVHRARLVTECSRAYFEYMAPQRLVLPSGRAVRTREGVAYTGSDADYCGDVMDGMFGPGVDPARARDTALRRSLEPRGGGGCGVVASRGMPTGILALVLAAAALLRKRRRS